MTKTENALPKPAFTALIKRHKASIIQYAGLLFVVVLFSILTGGQIFSSYNIRTLIGQTAPLMITCVGVIFMFTNGSMDIASGAVGGLCAMAAALILNATGSLPLAVLISVGIAVALYLFSAFVSIKFGLISTIASLAVMFMARGVVTYVCSLMPSTVISLDNYRLVNAFKNSPVLQIALMAGAVLSCWVLFSFTKIGKHTRAIGDNPVSAEQNGVRINRTKLLCALIAGLCVGVVAVFLLARAGSVSKNIGSGMEMGCHGGHDFGRHGAVRRQPIQIQRRGHRPADLPAALQRHDHGRRSHRLCLPHPGIDFPGYCIRHSAAEQNHPRYGRAEIWL